ncbi:hypothetical protein BH09BAC5_BH09BAC5_01500 [soil metagenome]
MKYIFTSLVFSLLFSFGLHCQNYRMVNANSEFFFTANGTSFPFYQADEVFGLKCDSANGNLSDSAYFPYRTLAMVLPFDSACNIDPNYPIWTGSKITVDNFSLHKWQTISGDSLKIKSQTAIGDTQTIYSYQNGNRIIGIHSSNTFTTFANISDSVENYTLQILNPSNNSLPGFWNGKQIIISKNNGVVQMPAVLNFPNDTIILFRIYAKRLKYSDVYPWQAGDTLQEFRGIDPYQYFYEHWTYNKYILARTQINPDSVVFKIREVTHYNTNNPNPYIPHDTITIDTTYLNVGNLNSYIRNEMPQQTIDSTHTYDLFYYSTDCGKLRMVDHYYDGIVIDPFTHCVQAVFLEPQYVDLTFLEGVAGYYYYHYPYAYNGITPDDFHNFYYSIGSSTCGTPSYVGIQELTAYQFHVWPNPTTDFLNFDFDGNYAGSSFEIFDLAGKQIQTVTLENGNLVDVSNLAYGFYVGKLISADGNDQHVIRFVKN